jgi:transcriptional regulator with XRE-family HTH domain
MSLAPIHRYIGRIIHLMRKEKGMRQSELALLAGLKQPNLSRIENGLVTPRPATLQRIAQALAVDVDVFYSDAKIQEVERKWAASLGPKQVALLQADKLSPVPLFDTSAGRPVQIDQQGEAQGQLEVVLQLPRDSALGQTKVFAVRVPDNAMHNPGGLDDFRLGEIVVFSGNVEARSGDYAYVFLPEGNVFRKVVFIDPNQARLIPLNSDFPERTVPRSDIRHAWKLVRQMRAPAVETGEPAVSGKSGAFGSGRV